MIALDKKHLTERQKRLAAQIIIYSAGRTLPRARCDSAESKLLSGLLASPCAQGGQKPFATAKGFRHASFAFAQSGLANRTLFDSHPALAFESYRPREKQ